MKKKEDVRRTGEWNQLAYWVVNDILECANTVLSGNPLSFRMGVEITFSWIDRKSPYSLIFGRFRFILNNENTNSLQIEASFDMTASASLENMNWKSDRVLMYTKVKKLEKKSAEEEGVCSQKSFIRPFWNSKSIMC